MKKKEKLGRKLLAFLLTLALVLGLMPGMGLTAYADWDGDPYANLVGTTTTVTFNEMPWYIIADNSTALDAGTVMLLAANDSFGRSAFKADYSSNSYNNSDVKAYLDNIVAGTAGEGKPDFKNVADAIKPVTLTTYAYNSTTDVAEETTDAKLYLLSTSEAETYANLISVGYWWLRSPGNNNTEIAQAAVVSSGNVSTNGASVGSNYDVRPALQLDLSKVTFDSDTKTFTLGLPTPAHTHDDIDFTAWTSADSLPTEAGSYYLTQDVTTISTWAVPAGTTNICLNGHGIRYAGSDNASVITVSEGAMLCLYDCDTTTKHYITMDGNGRGMAVSDTTSEGAVEVTVLFVRLF